MITIKITDRSIRMNGHAVGRVQMGLTGYAQQYQHSTCNLINSWKI